MLQCFFLYSAFWIKPEAEISKLSHLKGIFRRRGKKSYVWICLICSLVQTHKDPTWRFPFKREWHPEEARCVNTFKFELEPEPSFNLDSKPLKLLCLSMQCTFSQCLSCHHSGFVFHLFCLFSKLSSFFPIYKKSQKRESPCIENQG